MSAAQVRRLAHRIADDVVLQFTGQRGIADTKLAFTRAAGSAKEIYVADYDGAGPAAVTREQSREPEPGVEPRRRSLAFTSFSRGYPDLYRIFPFERRPEQVLAAFAGINTSPAWSPDGQHVALTLSKDGNPEIYVLNVGTGAFRRLTRHPAIDTEPNWSPDGRQIAFVSDRAGRPRIFAMDIGGWQRPSTHEVAVTTPSRAGRPAGTSSPTPRARGASHIWVVNADGIQSAAPRPTPGTTRAPPGRPTGDIWPSRRAGSEGGRSSRCSPTARSRRRSSAGDRIQVHRGHHVYRDRIDSLRTTARVTRRRHGHPGCESRRCFAPRHGHGVRRLREASRHDSGLGAAPRRRAGARAAPPPPPPVVVQETVKETVTVTTHAGASHTALRPRRPPTRSAASAQGVRGQRQRQGHLLRLRQVQRQAG